MGLSVDSGSIQRRTTATRSQTRTCSGSPLAPSDLSTVVGPMQECLTLPLAAGEVTLFTVPPDLCDVSLDLLPTPDLPRILLRHAASHVIAAVPLEPATGIVGVQPALPAPHG